MPYFGIVLRRIIMEYCDLGSLDSAISDGRFSDMVRPNAPLQCLREIHLLRVISSLSY